MTSPLRSWPPAAGLPLTTSCTSTPALRPSLSAIGGGRGRVPPAMPRYARRTRPLRIRAARMACVVPFMGTARPRPMPATAVLTPIRRACESASAPPELPGFSAASVWITSSMNRRFPLPSAVASERPNPLTTPDVTDPEKPIGFPIATTSWPTLSWSALPIRMGWRLSVRARATARSLSGSAPTTSTSCSVPSMNDALAAPPAATTWAEVTRNPSGVMTTPDPAPPNPRPARPMRRLATDGRTASATELTMTEYASSASCSVGVSTMVLTRLRRNRTPGASSHPQGFELLFEVVHDLLWVGHEALVGRHAEHHRSGVAEDADPQSEVARLGHPEHHAVQLPAGEV